MIPFTKMHGLGNDFVVLDLRERDLDIDRYAPFVADRHFGIGCDQVLLVEPSETAPIRMGIRNSDGSPAEMCGNGARAFALYAWDRNIVPRGVTEIETDAGLIVVEPDPEGIRVNMGQPRFGGKAVNATGDLSVADGNIAEAGWPLPGASHAELISMGNPHLVIFVESLDNIDLMREGSRLEHHQAFPQRINVEFVSRHSDAFKVRVWERGAGATLACGTGACAVGAAAVRNGMADGRVALDLPGGRLYVEWDGNGSLFLIGPATEVATGSIDNGAVTAWERASDV